MAARSESARRVSDCVTALLRDQPFFGSLALRLPIRPDATRETLASDGKDIRYAPQWVADTDADRIKTALARVVLACALKHHTRRGGRDPERWQRASQLVTHGLLRDAGFILPPEAEAWDAISAEQAYDRLPEPSADAEDPGDASSSSDVDDSGSAAGPQCGDDDEDQSAPSNPSGDNSPQEQDEPGSGSNSAGSEPSGQMPVSHDPCGTGEVMDADERQDDTGQSGESPVDTPAEEQAWDEAMHQAASLARAQGNAPSAVEETIRQAHRSILDWRSLLRRYMTDAARRDYSWSVPNRRFIDSGLYLPSMHSQGIDAIAIIIDTSASLPGETLALFWAEVREIAAELQPDSIYVLQVDAVLQDVAQYGHREVLIRCYVDEVVISCGAEVIARHRRSYDSEDLIFDPLHYLPLIEQKIGALDQAAPLAGWNLPEAFITLRRLLEARMGKAGKREYVQVLRLLETFRLEEVEGAVGDALRLGAIGFDAVKHLVLCRIERRPPRLNLDVYPYLPRARVATTSAKSYMSLLPGLGA